MSSEENLNFKSFLFESRKAANDIVAMDHIGEDVKKVLRDMLEICNQFEQNLARNTGQSADARMLKKKLDQAKLELKASSDTLSQMKSLFVMMIDEIKVITAETHMILKRHPDASDVNFQGATRIRGSVQKIADILVKATVKKQES